MSAATTGQAAGLPASRAGRKLDVSRNGEILDATIRVLAEVGFDRMTIDMVAARCGAARATIYRRWKTKTDLVVDAVEHLSAGDANATGLPDTGSLRGDLIAGIAGHSVEDQQLRIDVMSGLVNVAKTEPRLSAASADAGLQPWVASNRALLQRAVDRGEFPARDLDVLATVIPTMCVYRAAVQRLPVTRDFAIELIDHVIIPAMRGGN